MNTCKLTSSVRMGALLPSWGGGGGGGGGVETEVGGRGTEVGRAGRESI